MNTNDKIQPEQQVKLEQQTRQKAFERIGLNIAAALGCVIVVGSTMMIILVAVMQDSYDQYVESFWASQGVFTRIFSSDQPITLTGYVINNAWFIVLPIMLLAVVGSIGWMIIAITQLYPSDKTPALIAWEEAERKRAEEEASLMEWVAEIRLRPNARKSDEDQNRHKARLEIVQYFADRGMSLDHDPFRYCQEVVDDSSTHIRSDQDLRNHVHNPELQFDALLLFFFKASNYAGAALKANGIASELKEHLKLLDLLSTEVFQFKRTSQGVSSDSFCSGLDSAVNFALGVALFTGGAFVAYKVVKNVVPLATGAVSSVSDATLGRAGRLADAVTRRIEGKK